MLHTSRKTAKRVQISFCFTFALFCAQPATPSAAERPAPTPIFDETLADREARVQNAYEAANSEIREAWNHLLSDLQKWDAAHPPTIGERAARLGPSRMQSLAIIDGLINKKITAHWARNELEEDWVYPILIQNIVRFYARVPIPTDRSYRRARGNAAPQTVQSRFFEILRGSLDDFTVALLEAAGRSARSAGHPVIRADDANRAVQRLFPRRIDEFGDVHVFPRLAAAERVSLEASDCDSFRESGVIWSALNRALYRLPEQVALPDLDAAEILTEAAAQYGVLFLRLAGEIAIQDTDNVRLLPSDLVASIALVSKRVRRNNESEATSKTESQAPSVSAGVRAKDYGKFFTEVTSATGMDFVHRSSKWLSKFRHRIPGTAPTFSGGGIAAEDVDGDSHIDLLLVGGGGNALLLNDGRGYFTDITEKAGIVYRRPDGSFGEARSPIIADFDNDGLQDILITYLNDNHRLYRNLGSARFEDVSSNSGLGGVGLIGGPAIAFDFDGDGWLDVYIGQMGNYLERILPDYGSDNSNALPNKLFRNRGGMRFEDVSEESGAANRGWTQAVSHADLDRDGRQDIVVANDFGSNALLRNLGGGRFEDVTAAWGMTKVYHSMNVGITDQNGDDYPDVYISNIATLVKDGKFLFPEANAPKGLDFRAMAGISVKESDMFYLSQLKEGRLTGYEPSQDVERGPTSTGWAWDAEFFDFDHDGDDDLYVVNGTNDYNATFAFLYRHEAEDGKYDEYLLSDRREPNVFFVNQDGKLKNRSVNSGVDFSGNSRSTAYLDLDDDGDLDIAVNGFHTSAKVFRNNSEKRALNWLKVRLIGAPDRGSNRDAIGARLVVTAGDDLRVRREIQGGSGYLSMNPKQQHFGLANADSADLLIIWPNGERQRLEGLAANRAYLIHQGAQDLSEAWIPLEGISEVDVTK